MIPVVVVYVVGIFVSSPIYKSRAGAPAFGRFRIFGKRGFGVGWITSVIGKMFAWPVVLVVWLIKGRPQPRRVFNEKAAARQTETAPSASKLF